MCAAAAFMLALLHILLWLKDRKDSIYLLSMVMAVSAGMGAQTELALMRGIKQTFDPKGILNPGTML